MPKPKSMEPNRCYHVSGQDRVWLDGRWFYLGPSDSPKAIARFYALVAQYHANGQTIPERVETHPDEDAPLTVRCITAEFRSYARQKFSHDTGRRGAYLNLCDTVDAEYADTVAEEFGPRKLAAIRDLLLATKNRRGKHNTRRYVNEQVNNIVRIFEHGVSRELVDVKVIIALRTLKPLAPGDSVAEESEPVQAVDIEAVRLTAKHLSPVINAMVCIQAATGMRPSELFRMRPRDIEVQPDGVWVYKPPKHKTSHKGKLKAVPIVSHARAALAPFINGRDPEDFCFKPAESAQWHRDQRTAARTTPANQGDRPGYTKATRKADGPTRKYGESFTKDSYARAIKRAAAKAGTDHWFPYQLRHTAASVVCEALGIEITQALLGHSKAAQTQHYAKQILKRAIEAAEAGPKV